MTGPQLRDGRTDKGWTQQKAAAKLRVSQPYLSLMENDSRPVPEKLAWRAAHLYRLSPAVLPVAEGSKTWQCGPNELAAYLAGLGYPKFSYLKPGKRNKNPAEVLLAALNCENLESRLAEALPWVVLEYPDLDWKWLVTAAKQRDLQNRLGFVTALARRLAEQHGVRQVAKLLQEQEAVLDRAKLAREDTLCRSSLSKAERLWVRKNRPVEARRWNLLTDLSLEHLNYAP